MSLVEHITWNGRTLAHIIRAEHDPEKTTFMTPPDCNLQVGFVVYPAAGEIPRHVHLPLERRILGTPEVLVVKKGRCHIDLYNDAWGLVATRELVTGDIVVMVDGGHGFRIMEDTILLEVKQGPYTGMAEKERF